MNSNPTPPAANNVIPLFGYCIRGCGRPAVRRQALPNGDVLHLCEDQPVCRGLARERLPVPAYCNPSNETRGPLYEPRLDVKEIAKRMRQAIRTELPGVKASVRIDRFSGGSSIDIRLVDANCKIQPLIPRRQWFEERDRRGGLNSWKENFSAEMQELMAKLKDIHGRWNRDNSDGMTDYFDVHYYGGVSDQEGASW